MNTSWDLAWLMFPNVMIFPGLQGFSRCPSCPAGILRDNQPHPTFPIVAMMATVQKQTNLLFPRIGLELNLWCTQLPRSVAIPLEGSMGN